MMMMTDRSIGYEFKEMTLIISRMDLRLSLTWSQPGRKMWAHECVYDEKKCKRMETYKPHLGGKVEGTEAIQVKETRVISKTQGQRGSGSEGSRICIRRLS